MTRGFPVVEELVQGSQVVVPGALPHSVETVIRPSGDATGATDLAAFVAAQSGPFRHLGKALPGNPFYINGLVDLTGFIGQGGGLNTPLTEIVCVGAGAGVILSSGSGLWTGGFRINGNNVSTLPLLINGGPFPFNISVIGSAQDNILIQGSQNIPLIGIQAQNAARDNLVLDLGCGGLDFIRHEFNAAGRYNVRSIQSGTSPVGAYGVPTDINFISGEIERGQNAAAVSLEKGAAFYFGPANYIEVPVNGFPAVNILSTFGGVVFDGGVLQNDGGAATTAAIVPAAGSGGVHLRGQVTVVSFPSVIDNTGNVPCSIAPGASNPATGTTFKAGTEGATSNGIPQMTTVIQNHQAASSQIERSIVAGDAGERFRRFADGSGWIGSGGDFVGDTTWARSGAGVLGIGNTVVFPHVSLAYSASITPDFSKGPWQQIVASNGTAFTINAPINPPDSSHTGRLAIQISNASGGALGAITWNTIYKFTTGAWVSPAVNFNRVAWFEWDGARWVCSSLSTVDY